MKKEENKKDKRKKKKEEEEKDEEWNAVPIPESMPNKPEGKNVKIILE